MFCTNCSTALDSDFAFCPKCGTKVVAPGKALDVHIGYLLDRTGSMAAIAQSTCDAFNEFVRGQKALDASTRMTLVQFDSESTDVLYANVDISAVLDRNASNYQPRGMTPLWDAVGSLITNTEQATQGWAGKVLCVIQTDGQENASKEWTAERVRENIKRLEEAGWQFMFLGAGVDAWVGERMGIQSSYIMTYGHTDVGTRAAGQSMGTTTSDWRIGRRATAAFTDQERTEAEKTK